MPHDALTLDRSMRVVHESAVTIFSGTVTILRMQLRPRAEKALLALIIGLFILLGITYALVTPAFEASDELWHYPMVQHLAGGNPLPVQVFDPAQAGPWNQEASQPPLYYYLGAALTFWIDQSDMSRVRWLNPHVDNGVITPDGNNNLAIHDPAANPWQGALLAVRIVRLVSVLLGALTVYLTYRIAGETAPGRADIALGAAALNAFLPMFLFISGAVNNDNLAIPLASLAILLMIRVVTRRVADYFPVKWWEWAVLGIVIGLAVLTKEGTLGLIPLAFGTAVVAVWQKWFVPVPSGSGKPASTLRHQLKSATLGLFLSLILISLPILIIAGWWYYRNIVLYGDWLGWNAFIAVLGQRAHPASLTQLWGERNGFMMSYWGLFGGVNVPMTSWIYRVLNVFLVLSVIGFAIYLLELFQTEWRIIRTSRGNRLKTLLRAVERNFALIVVLLFSAAVIFGLIQWATTTWSSQGRLVFTAISALSTLMAIGLAGLGDSFTKHLKLPASFRPIFLAMVSVILFAVAALAPILWIRPAYQPPTASDTLFENINARFGDQIRLNGYEVEYDNAQPGDTIRVRLGWEVIEAMERDWSVFIHLNDPVLGRPIAQRDMYPGRGLLATRLLAPGQQIVDEYVLTIPQTAVAPAELDLVVGLYDFDTGDRLPLEQGGDSLTLDTVALNPGEGPYPNPVSLFFENGLELIGFSVNPRRATAGQAMDVVTYWRPSRPLADDYSFFGQIVAADTTRHAAADIAPPQPTSAWVPGEVYELHLLMTLDPATPPEVYPLIIGLYTRTADGGFDRLQLVTSDGRLTDDFLQLTQIKVDAP